jgi:hypothetical protein
MNFEDQKKRNEKGIMFETLAEQAINWKTREKILNRTKMKYESLFYNSTHSNHEIVLF